MSLPWEYTDDDSAALKLFRSVQESRQHHHAPPEPPELKASSKAASTAASIKDHDRLSEYSSLPSTPSKLTSPAYEQLQKQRYREDSANTAPCPSRRRDYPPGIGRRINRVPGTEVETQSANANIMSTQAPDLPPAQTSMASHPAPANASSAHVSSWLQQTQESTLLEDEEARLADEASRVEDETQQMLAKIQNNLVEAIEWEKKVRINAFRLITLRAEQQTVPETGGQGEIKKKNNRRRNTKKGKGRDDGQDGIQ
ncbi:hypothetical protein NM208_g14034 [Fusarium decemcellulare]|uniref:Uncharacterized protein n=1 Tax=Fusarium decemcellulare TaxID=57161 RepID=A0ACC1RK56_9HYPO|nr:hypothetical protein NM208_g14034 [Fusarium decemcellulare]